MSDVAILDNVTTQFINALYTYQHRLAGAGQQLLLYLGTIQLCVATCWQLLAGEGLQAMVAQIIRCCFIIGFFFTCIGVGYTVFPQIINGLMEVGQGSVTSLSPSGIIDQGLSIVGALIKAFSSGISLINNPFVSLVAVAVAISVLIIYGLIASELAIVMVKSYALIAVSPLFMAFGSSEVTRSMTVRYFSSVIGLGLKLMTLYMLLSVGHQLSHEWIALTQQASSQKALTPMFIVLVTVIVYYMILRNVPPFIAGLSGVGGFHNTGAEAVTMAINTGTSGARLAMKAMTMTKNIGSNVASNHSRAMKGISAFIGAKQHGASFSGAVKHAFTQGIKPNTVK